MTKLIVLLLFYIVIGTLLWQVIKITVSLAWNLLLLTVVLIVLGFCLIKAYEYFMK